MKLKNLNFGPNSNCDKNQIVTKLKNLENYKTYSVKEAQKLKL